MNPCILAQPPEDEVGDGRWHSMDCYQLPSYVYKQDIHEVFPYVTVLDDYSVYEEQKYYRHNRYVQEAETTESEVLFIGDSIIQQLQFSTIWAEKFISLHCCNFGIGGDRVENVLWRIQNGELDFHVKLKAVVLFVGTNNTDCTPHEVYEGILEIIKNIKQKLGNVTVILPTLLPRGQYPNPYRERNDQVNTFLIDKFCNPDNVDELTPNVIVVRIHDNIVQNDTSIPHFILHDYLHLTNSAYWKIFGPVYDKLCDILAK